MVVLVVATAAVVLNREGTTDQVDVASGGLGDVPDPQYVLPPADSTEVRVAVGHEDSIYMISYVDPDGTPLDLTAVPLAMMDPGRTASQLIEDLAANHGGTEMPIGPLGAAYLSCANTLPDGAGDAVGGGFLAGPVDRQPVLRAITRCSSPER